MEPNTSSWSRDLVLADSLDTLREVTMQRHPAQPVILAAAAGGREKTSTTVTWHRSAPPADVTVNGLDVTAREE